MALFTFVSVMSASCLIPVRLESISEEVILNKFLFLGFSYQKGGIEKILLSW